MTKTGNPSLIAAVVCAACAAVGRAEDRAPSAAPTLSTLESAHLSEAVRVTAGLARAGEGYFAPDVRSVCYQGVPTDYPFYQIYVQPFDAAAPAVAAPRRISTGRGRTTCAWFSPDGARLLFASSHLDPALDATEADARAKAAEDARTGRRRRYQWDFDPEMEIFVASLADGRLERLTNSKGYDAECSYSPDGTKILFVSDRDGDPDIYVMEADGSGVRQLTDSPGYDGGPFFSPDGRWIAYRSDRLEREMLQIHVMRADGTGDVAVTSGKGVHWAPFWHPTKPWLVWTGADHSDPDRRPNYDLWMARYDTPDDRFVAGTPLRLTDHEGADVLPSFSPDGTLLLWTASRDGGGRSPASQLWVARFDLGSVERDLPAVSEHDPR